MTENKNLGLGCMGMAFKNETDSAEVVRAALDAGVAFLNTGDFYSSGESEMVVGDALRGVPRSMYYVSLKFGGLMSPNGMRIGNTYGIYVDGVKKTDVTLTDIATLISDDGSAFVGQYPRSR